MTAEKETLSGNSETASETSIVNIDELDVKDVENRRTTSLKRSTPSRVGDRMTT